MLEAILSGLGGLGAGGKYLFAQGGPNVIMLGVAGVMLYLAIAKGVEPLLLLPIAFGCLLANLPLSANVLSMNLMATKMPFVGRG